ncbi:MAG: DUF3883 domain-containing protein, partial [Myxococcota bacterium]
VYDILGSLFDQRELRTLLLDAIRYGNDERVRARLEQTIEGAVEHDKLEDLLQRRALVHNFMDHSSVKEVRAQIQRAHARRLQPHFVRAFFKEAFQLLGGSLSPQGPDVYEIRHVPRKLIDAYQAKSTGETLNRTHERICFDKEHVTNNLGAELICPGTPLLESTIDVLMERYGDVLKQGAILVDESDPGEHPRILFYIEHSIQDGRKSATGGLTTISKRLQFVEFRTEDQRFVHAGDAPYLDYRPLKQEELGVQDELNADGLSHDWEEKVLTYAVQHLVPSHLQEVKTRRLAYIEKVRKQVHVRLHREIRHWDSKAQQLKVQERQGKKTRLAASEAQEKANALKERLAQRMEQLNREKHITPGAPIVKGGALILPQGYLEKTQGNAISISTEARKRIERRAIQAVIDAERALGREPFDCGDEKRGYDIESRCPKTGDLWFIEVKGCSAQRTQVTLTCNEILLAHNDPERHILAIVIVEKENKIKGPPTYVRSYCYGQPGLAQTSSSFSLSALLDHGGPPS